MKFPLPNILPNIKIKQMMTEDNKKWWKLRNILIQERLCAHGSLPWTECLQDPELKQNICIKIDLLLVDLPKVKSTETIKVCASSTTGWVSFALSLVLNKHKTWITCHVWLMAQLQVMMTNRRWTIRRRKVVKKWSWASCSLLLFLSLTCFEVSKKDEKFSIVNKSKKNT